MRGREDDERAEGEWKSGGDRERERGRDRERERGREGERERGREATRHSVERKECERDR